MLLLESDLGLCAMARRYVCRFRRLCRFRRTCFSRLKFRNFKLKENPTYHYPGISLASLLSVANVDRFFLHVYMPESEVPGSSFFIPIRLRDRFRDLSSLDFDTEIRFRDETWTESLGVSVPRRENRESLIQGIKMSNLSLHSFRLAMNYFCAQLSFG